MKIGKYALPFGLLAVGAYAEPSVSDTCFLCLPDTLSNELQSIASEGFMRGLAISSAIMVSVGIVMIVIHLINRGAGR